METLEIVSHKCVTATSDEGPSLALEACYDLHIGRPLWMAENNDVILTDPEVSLITGRISTTPMGKPVAVTHIGMLDAVYAVTDSEMFVIKRGEDEAEFVGSIDCGILAASWSPDQELLVIINGNNDLVCLSKDLEPIFEHPVISEDFGADAPVTIGWGKKETQFQGSKGKLANQPKVQDAEVPYDHQNPSISWRGDGLYFATSTFEHGRRVIRVWHRDGTLSATSERVGGLESPIAWKPSGSLIASTQRLPHRHDIVFFEKNGLRHGEFTLPFDKDEVHVKKLAWNCTSDILAIWSISLKEGKFVQPPSRSYLQFWRRCNYHWYLQQELRFDTESSSSCWLTSFEWHNEDGMRCIVGTSSHVMELTFRLNTIDSGKWKNDGRHSSVVAVPDGSRLHITPFRRVTVPPPMFDSCIDFNAPLVAVAPYSISSEFSGEDNPYSVGDGDIIAALCSDQSISIWSRCDDQNKRKIAALGKLDTLLPLPAHHRVYRHIVICDDIIFVTTRIDHASHDKPTVDTVHALHIEPLHPPSAEISAAHTNISRGSVVVPESETKSNETHRLVYIGNSRLQHIFESSSSSDILACCPHPKSARTILAESITGHIWTVRVNEVTSVNEHGTVSSTKYLIESQLCSIVTQLAAPCPHIVCLPLVENNCGSTTPTVGQIGSFCSAMTSEQNVKEQPMNVDRSLNSQNSRSCSQHFAIFGISQAHKLVANESFITDGCNSFSHNCDFLIFSTHYNTCRFLPLRPELLSHHTQLTDEAKQKEYDHTVRAVERGSRIVCTPRNDIRVVLQMPRGNLEVISPRALILSRAKSLLDKRAYADVFFMLRKHRLSLNLLYDHNPATFEEHVQEFVHSINNAQHLNLFIMELKDEDTTQTMYSVAYKNRPQKSIVSDKVEHVCQLIRDACIALDESSLLETILTTYIKLGSRGIEIALERVLAIRDATPPPEQPSHVQDDRVRAALKYMLLLVDVDVLYNEALGSYNLEFALMVAQVAQKDPKQYLPFLNSLRQEPLHLRKYRIDMHLRRFVRALADLAEAETDHLNEAMELMREHSLYAEALRLFGNASVDVRENITKDYANFLTSCGRHEQAGILFEMAGEYDLAVKAYMHVLNWKAIFGITAQRKISRSDESRLAHDVGESLKVAHRFEEAGNVLVNYADDVVAGINAYVQGRIFDTAMLIAKRHERQDLISSVISPAVLDTLQALTHQYQELRSLMSSRVTRLGIVRAEKAEKQRLAALGLLDRDVIFDDAADGAASDLYSDASTVRSRRSDGRMTHTSMHSRTTTSAKSSRGRRKHEAKKFSLKEGGIFEEEALVHSIHQLVAQVDRAQQDIHSALLAGVRLGYSTAVDELQDAYASCRQFIHSILTTVWPNVAVAASSTQHTFTATSQQQGPTKTRPSENVEEEAEENVPIPPRPVFTRTTSWQVVTERYKNIPKGRNSSRPSKH